MEIYSAQKHFAKPDIQTQEKNKAHLSEKHTQNTNPDKKGRKIVERTAKIWWI